MPVVRPVDLFGDQIGPELFGANILATVDKLGPDGTYDEAVDDLGITHVRYPGGSLTERYFDISNPTQTDAPDVTTGESLPFLPYDEFMMWAEANAHDVTIVLPTLTQLGDTTDANGDRFPEIDEQTLRGFIRDTLNGVYGAPEIRAFEIGNEYYGSGAMTSVEYGRLAAEMAVITRDEIDQHPFADLFAETDVLIQMGDNFGTAALDDEYRGLGTPLEQLAMVEQDYGMEFPPDTFLFSNGSISWARVNSALVAREFDTVQEQEAVDGIVAHVYGRGLDEPNRWYSDYRIINNTMTDTFPEATKYVTEWNTRSLKYSGEENEIYGLENAQEKLHMMLGMVEYQVEAAHIWPVQQNTATELAGDEGETDLTVAGEMFRMMSQSLPGTHSIVLDDSSPAQGDSDPQGPDHWLFAGQDHATLFVFADDAETGTTSLDLSQVFLDPGTVSITRLGVQPGDNPASRNAEPDVENLDPDQVMSGATAEINLGPREILHLTFDNPTYSETVENLLSDELPKEDTTPEPVLDPPLPMLPVLDALPPAPSSPQPEASPLPEEENGGFDVGSLLGGLLFLPMLMAMG